ncbi:MAG: hypothetical protein J7578_00280 [Chitinophagaceae bacterium]|nr:hypothetical protein [Chitinophagaceae bacterium]
MKNISIELKNEPGALARMGELLGNAGISLEGGGMFVQNDIAIANFLVGDAEAAKALLEENGMRVSIREVAIHKLDQGTPGQLGKYCRMLADKGINILVQYSDHANRLILVLEDPGTRG